MLLTCRELDIHSKAKAHPDNFSDLSSSFMVKDRNLDVQIREKFHFLDLLFSNTLADN